MLSRSSIALIEASTVWRNQRVEMFDLPEGRVVVKGQRAARSALRFGILSALSRLTGSPLLRAVPAPGGRQAQDTEIRRLHTLAGAGVPVPQVLHVSDAYFVMTRIEGASISSQIVSSPPLASVAIERGLDGLCKLHARGQYLSQAFARNILEHEGQLWFIDFEDDPLQVMDLEDAQARDLLAFMLSAIWASRVEQPTLMTVWRAFCQRIDPLVQIRLRRAIKGLAFLRHLPTERKPWGRDVVTVQALAAFMSHWNTEDSARN
jgi:tRNA A-37 threonylcarbamoyl transferase component Bud32